MTNINGTNGNDTWLDTLLDKYFGDRNVFHTQKGGCAQRKDVTLVVDATVEVDLDLNVSILFSFS